MALYVHYLYLPGKAGQQQYPPKMTPHLRKRLGVPSFSQLSMKQIGLF